MLVIDDDANFLELVAAVVETAGCQAITATDGFSGMMLAVDARPALILCDFSMPDIDGGEVLRILQEDPYFGDVPRVLMSGYGCPDLQEIPADAFIAKPINTQSLRRLVRAFTRSRSNKGQSPAPAIPARVPSRFDPQR